MKANELRIGNYVTEKADLFKVTSITRDGQLRLFSAGENHTSGVSKINSIPLTEEWLLKFNFEDLGKNYFAFYHFRLNQFSIIREQDVYSFCYETYDGEDVDLEIKYVHQLQNLYFALTGKELKIKNHE